MTQYCLNNDVKMMHYAVTTTRSLRGYYAVTGCCLLPEEVGTFIKSHFSPNKKSTFGPTAWLLPRRNSLLRYFAASVHHKLASTRGTVRSFSVLWGGELFCRDLRQEVLMPTKVLA